MTVAVGDTVRAHYNSGIYIGNVEADRDDRFLIKVLAVIKHPMQGDLHHPGALDDNVFFHSRKALAHYEKMNVAKAVVYPYNDPIPDYRQSLQDALTTMKNKLIEKNTDFSKAALKKLTDLENNDYQKSYYK
ncbi:sporulation phosphorelay system protein KapB [Lentibacillus sp. N15]|uniref:sporulation phosphorelay system protein KapB n=1 Tax=Lentibacillus songyuanensis TaxID=3136161 RepID=UPI0031BB75A6